MPILATPGFTPPLPTPPEIVGMSLLWHGWDGSTWDLGDDHLSGVHMQSGFRGLFYPEIDWYSDAFAGVDGISDRGFRSREREMFWPIRIYQGDKSQAWVDYNRAFLKTLRPGKYGVLEIVQPDGEARRIRLRLQSDGSPQINTDPALIGWQDYGLYLTAPQPLYEGDPITVTFQAPSAESFFDVNRFIGSSFSYDSASISNPGEVAAWPVWEITGASTSVAVGVGSSLVTYPQPLSTTDSLVIDTNPTAQSARKNGVRVTSSLTTRDFRAVPEGAAVPLSVQMTGSGLVTATITPRYFTGL